MRYKKHILSFVLIILMIIFTVATTMKPNDTITIYDKITYAFENEYLVIKVKTRTDPHYYHMIDKNVWVYFEGTNKYQIFTNFFNADGEKSGYYTIVDYPNEPQIIKYDDFVFETSVDDKYFIIKIKEELLINNNVKISFIQLETSNAKKYNGHYRYKEHYRNLDKNKSPPSPKTKGAKS